MRSNNIQLFTAFLSLSAWLYSCGQEASFQGNNVEASERHDSSPNDSLPEERTPELATETPKGAIKLPEIKQPQNNNQTPVPKPGEPTPPSPPSPKKWELSWDWSCDSYQSDDSALKGPDEHSVSGEGELTVNVNVDICSPHDRKRDIIFIVDVSDSMRNWLNFGNDPLDNQGSCGRLNAIKSVTEKLPANANISYVTFGGEVVDYVGGFLGKDDFLNDHANSEIFCNVSRRTNYKKAFLKAEDILASAREDSSKEIYFISDGQPNSSQGAGIDVAERIKEDATIATLMLKGDDTILKNDIASRIDDNPLHDKVSSAENLEQALAKLAQKHWQQLGFYLPNGEFTSVDPGTAQARFGGFTLNPGESLEFTIEFVDSSGSKTTRSGKINYD